MNEQEIVEVADNQNATEQQGNLTSDDLLNFLSSEPSETQVVEPPQEETASEPEEPVLSQSTEEVSDGEEYEEPEQGDEDSDLEEDEGVNEEPEQPKSVQKLLKQVSRLTARSKSAEEAVELLQAQVQSMKLEKKVEDNPTLEEAMTMDQLEKLRQEALSAKKWARRHEDEEYVTEGEKEYTRAEIKQIRDSAEEHLEELIPARAQFLQTKSQSDELAFKDFPFLSEQESDSYKLLQKTLADPNLKGLDKLPNGLYLRALMIEGVNSVKSRTDPSKPTRSKRVARTRPKPPPPTAPGSDTSPPVRGKPSATDKRKQMLGDSNISEGQLSAFLATY